MTAPREIPRHLLSCEGIPAKLAAAYASAGDITAAAMCLAITAHEDHVLAPAGWDVPPTLWCVMRGATGPRSAELGLCLFTELPASGTDGLAAAVSDVARTLATAQDGPGVCLDVLAWLVASEGWAALPGPGQARAPADLLAAAVSGQLHARPERTETRMVLAADRAGYRYSLFRPRGAAPALTVDTGQDKQDSRFWIASPVMDALGQLIRSTPAGRPAR